MALAVTVLLAPAYAAAKGDDVRVTIAGTAQVGSTLRATATREGEATWTWLRCKDVAGKCKEIKDAPKTPA